MQRHPLMLLPLLLLNASLAAGGSQQSSDVASRIDGYAAPFAAAGHLSGTLLVARGGEVLYERSWGLADRERGRAFDAETPSCIASLTKPTTVILASQLIESGTISLSDPISKWLEDFPNGNQIQFRHLLFHFSGIPHRLTAPTEENVPRTAADMVELARGRDLDFKPGSRRNYSSGGFSVMVRVLELASGKSYELLLRERILEPLNLSHTLHPGPGVDLPQAAKSYTWSLDGRKAAPEKHYSFLIGAGALFSTPRDLLAISRTLIDGGFGEQARRRLLRGGMMSWNGITNSYRAFLDYDAKTDLTLVLVSNQMVGANDLLRRNVPRIVAGESVEVPSVPRPQLVSLPEELLDRYAGQYKIGGSSMPVTARAGALFANNWILLPISETSFFSPQDYATVSVVGDDASPEALDWAGMNCPRLGPLAD
jgi:CubicO group peptidase (beta-lactamase class C family)